MSITLKVYDNGDHTALVWIPTDGQPIPRCRGFALRRIKNGREDYLHGFVGFSENQKPDPANPWEFPVQRFMWWDYDVTPATDATPGDKVQYSVIPVVGDTKDALTADTSLACPLTPEMTVTGQDTAHIAAFFNRGIVATQWVSRALKASPDSSIKKLIVEPGNPIRNALSGLLRPRILRLLADVKAAGGSIYAALYELNDPELIAALTALGQSCHLILGNGAFKGGPPPGNDENHEVREQLRGKVDLHDRIVSSGHFAHNKFVIFCDASGAPQRVLTGSTNFTSTGLCTQANNALIIEDPQVAQNFLSAWKRLEAAGNGYPPTLVNGNSTSTPSSVDGGTVTPWFVKTSAQQDLVHARKLINAARDGVLFLFFNPGVFEEDPNRWTLLQNILDRHSDQSANFNPDLYIRGVVNQEIALLTEPGTPKKGKKQPDAVLDPSVPAAAPVTLFSGAIKAPTRLSQDVLVPRAIKDQFHQWEKELLSQGVNIHSKVIVIDPFGARPVVMTGSHNMGFKASNANDDNLVIIEGNAPLAAAYAANIIAIYQTYRWNSYVEAHRQDPRVWHGLQDNDTWQNGYLTGDRLAEINFWLGMNGAATTTGAGTTAHSATAVGSAPKKGRKPTDSKRKRPRAQSPFFQTGGM
jgi:phosphatidylserine/phosphatidylglycerophosphate/cardiolipin synthase-like enzyme